jgi:hypothetical protein
VWQIRPVFTENINLPPLSITAIFDIKNLFLRQMKLRHIRNGLIKRLQARCHCINIRRI